MIMLITHVSTLLRWDVKWFNFCPSTLLDQRLLILPQPKDKIMLQFSINKDLKPHRKFHENPIKALREGTV